mgnify:CR=1 FL=1|tara:strand:- start:99322 stop:100017 length:696 start_codon:yes stop_codon:yes gene_type:complete
MKNILLTVLIITGLVSCTTGNKGSMLVTGEIKGLKKGTLYLKKMNDTLLVSVDSVFLDGVETFSLSDEIESPEIYYLSLNNDKNKQVLFFGDIGTTVINTKLDKFVFGATITGLKNQQLLDEYTEMLDKFSDKNLDLIKAGFEAKKIKDSIKSDSLQGVSDNLLRRRYYYTTNFAVQHKDAEIAPYLALTELYNANIKLLDTVNNSLTKEVKRSKYGVALDKFIAEIKSKE